MVERTFLQARRRLIGHSVAGAAAQTGVAAGEWAAFERGRPLAAGPLEVDDDGRLVDVTTWTAVRRLLRLAGTDLDLAFGSPAGLARLVPVVVFADTDDPQARTFNDAFAPGMVTPRQAWLVSQLAGLSADPVRWADPDVPLWVRDRLPATLADDPDVSELLRARVGTLGSALAAGTLPLPGTVADQLLWSLLLDLADDVWPHVDDPMVGRLDDYGTYDDPAWTRRMLLGDDRYLDVYDTVEVDPAVLLG